MKNTLKINFAERKIVMDREFSTRATNPFSPEYLKLQAVRADYPNFTVVRKTIKKNPHKETYKGLSYQYMEDYITTHEPRETRKAVLEEFYEKRLISQCHSQAFRYPVIKQWFLARYPEIAEFGIETKEETLLKPLKETA
ncbi:MAG: hypothetical protein J1E34_03775 [Oscillospiraceae bacterium]|nr:hypothetical protein [Oscillospiraceae bacterium]